ncbi:uncharacterized protein BCR38DRAFT_459264 [Pseudomassariella vexata]|uniref:Uncharacterized protein n=1 Tax=Pseudomassariella vexata TaxID=1141098 RepID=A0A1Y2DQ96_9PEZI|nr:uncharacterized protein BCR38DRAFT_459264 [Pseudomassariella vexata]ORY61359.1 hypothetical protein BCR38DRAFT_459264 [Pseudomassariella vexata]
MATTTSSYFPLATEDPATRGNDSGSGSANSGGAIDSDAGASGTSSGGVQLSHGAMVAIIVVVCVVAVLGISMAVLFYIAKKREWKIKETIRKSAKKVVTALTPRRSEFPKSVKELSGRSSRNRVRLDDVPPTPRLRPEDLEKGYAQPSTRQSPEGRSKRSKWPKK